MSILEKKLVKPYNTYVLNLNDQVVAEPPGHIICYGLGSCIGLFLYDRFARVGAGFHLVRPDMSVKDEAAGIIEGLLASMIDRSAHILTIRAKITGGANVLSSSFGVGESNTHYIKQYLKKKGILLAAEDTLGQDSRTARLDLDTGELFIRNSKQETYTI